MVNYKLTYIDGRGLGEATRQVFHLAGVSFEDFRLTFGGKEFEEFKPKTPFGQFPVLNVDGFETPQSTAILRYLARKFGYAGKTPEEEAWVDAIVDQFKDFLGTFREFVFAVILKKPAEEIERIRKDIVNPARDTYFKILTGILEKSKSGFLVGDNLTFADLVVADNLYTLETHGFIVKEDHPRIVEYQTKIKNLPKLKEYLEKRPDHPF